RRALRWRMRGAWDVEARFGRDDVTRLDEGIRHRITVRHALAADAREGVDVELVIGKDHKVLEMLRIRSGIVVEPVQRIVHTGSTEHGERLSRASRQRAVDDRIVNGGEIWRVEQIAQRPVANWQTR